MIDDVTQVVLTIDVGSSSIKCGAYEIIEDTNVQQLDNCFLSLSIRTVEPNTGKIELISANKEGNSLFDDIDGLIDAMLDRLRTYPKDLNVRGIGFSTFCMNLLALDQLGNPLGKDATISYACSTEAVRNECAILKSSFASQQQQQIYQRTGAPIHSSYALPQLRVFYNDPKNLDLISQISVWQTIASVCISRWRGVSFSPISFSEASWTGMFNFRTFEWDDEVISLISENFPKHLPPLCDYADDVSPLGGIREHGLEKGVEQEERNPYCDRWPELSGCRIFYGLGDGACANVGSGCWNSQNIAVTIGTSAAARVCIPWSPTDCGETFDVPKGLFCYRLDRSHLILGGALTDGGSMIEWARSLLNLHDDDSFNRCLIQVEELLTEDYQRCLQDGVITSDITLLPFLSGERSVGYRDDARFCISGLTRTSTTAHFMKACMMGIVLRLECILTLLFQKTEIGSRMQSIVASGSALEKNVLWRQMLADCSGVSVELLNSIQENTSFGLGIMLSVALSMEQDNISSSTSYLKQDLQHVPSIRSTPNKPIRDAYWLPALESQEKLIHAILPSGMNN